MKRIFLLSAFLLPATISGYAQMGFGAEIGYNLSNYSVKLNGAMASTDFRGSARLGALSDMAITDNLYFQPGVYYVANGYKTDIAGGFRQYTVNTIEIPLNIEYKIGMLGTNRVFLGAGPYFGYNISGTNYVHTKTVESRSALNVGKGVANDFRQIDLGAGINIGYQHTSGLFARFRSQMGFLDLYPGTAANSSITSYSFCLSAGYLFYRKGKDGKIRIDRDRTGKKVGRPNRK